MSKKKKQVKRLEEKPLSLDMDFEEAMKRLSKVKIEEVKKKEKKKC